MQSETRTGEVEYGLRGDRGKQENLLPDQSLKCSAVACKLRYILTGNRSSAVLRGLLEGTDKQTQRLSFRTWNDCQLVRESSIPSGPWFASDGKVLLFVVSFIIRLSPGELVYT